MKRQFFTLKIALMALIVLGMPSIASGARRCRVEVNPPVKAELITENIPSLRSQIEYLSLNGMMVTDMLRYPVEMVLGNLGTHEGLLYGKTVVTVGEGLGLLLPHLVKIKIPTLGIDLFYFSNFESNHRIADEIRAYEEHFGQHLKRGDATRLPIPDRSTDVYISHAMVNNMRKRDKQKALKEALRVTDKYGEIYIFGYEATDISWISKVLEDRGYARYRFENVSGEFEFAGRQIPYSKYRLRIEL
ncbi:MAG: class I SAM-dependent methyltransferase [Pseudomonadota bacterium]